MLNFGKKVILSFTFKFFIVDNSMKRLEYLENLESTKFVLKKKLNFEKFVKSFC